MIHSRLDWLLPKKRFFFPIIFDFSILFILIFYKNQIYKDLNTINFTTVTFFCLLWVGLNYIFGIYFFRLDLFLLDSLKICIKNTSKVSISLSLIYLFNSIILKVNFISSYDKLFSINFLVLFIFSTCIVHILLIIYLHKLDYNLRNWILVSDRRFENIFVDNLIEINNNFNIQIINSFLELNLIDYENKNFQGVIISPEKVEDNLDLAFLQRNNLSYFTIKDWCQIYIQRYPPEIICSSDILRINKTLKDRNFEFHLKRIADIILSAFLLIIFSPILLIFSILIFLEDRGPIIYSQIRTGLNSKKFRIFKLRSMKVNSEINGAVWAKNNDNRVSKVGKIIRATRIDELPQLWSVLKGEMSLIGPRPERPEFDSLLNKKIPFYYTRYSIKPGLSGWAQVNYPYGASTKDSYNKLSYDLFYIENFSFILDFLILLKTIRLLINVRGYQQGSKI